MGELRQNSRQSKKKVTFPSKQMNAFDALMARKPPKLPNSPAKTKKRGRPPKNDPKFVKKSTSKQVDKTVSKLKETQPKTLKSGQNNDKILGNEDVIEVIEDHENIPPKVA